MPQSFAQTRTWLAEQVSWRQFRAAVALPATIMAILWLGFMAVSVLPFVLVLWGLIPLSLISLVAAAIGYGWLLIAQGQYIEKSRWVICCLMMLSGWLVFEYVSYPFEPSYFYDTGKALFGLVSSALGGATLQMWHVVYAELQWTLLIVSAWLLIELILPTLGDSGNGPRRLWGILLGLSLCVCVVTVNVSLRNQFTANYLASPASAIYRARKVGTIGEALCRGNWTLANERASHQGAALKNDEVAVLAGCLDTQLESLPLPLVDDELRRQTIRSMASVIAAHRMTPSEAACDESEEIILGTLFRNGNGLTYLTAAQEGGLRLGCLKQRQEGLINRSKGAPVWWEFVAGIDFSLPSAGSQNQAPIQAWTGDAQIGKKRLESLKTLGIEIKQKSADGRDLMSQISWRSSDEWIEVLVDAGLNVQGPADSMPVPVRIMYRTFGMEEHPAKPSNESRLVAKVGNPTREQIWHQLRGGSPLILGIIYRNNVSDEQQAQLWALIARQIGDKQMVDYFHQHIAENAGPEVRALFLKLEKDLNDDGARKH